MTYVPPLRDIRFVLDHIADLPGLAALPGFEHADPDTVHSLLEEYARFVADVMAPLNRVGDQQGSRLDPGTGVVTTPPGFIDAYRRYVEAGWNAVPFDPEFGGGGFPWTLAVSMQELFTSANMAFSLCPLLTQGAIDLLETWGSDEQKSTYLPKLISGEWTGTMNLTEPEAGSDVGALRTKAVPADDGTWRITGTKIFITYGEHDLADNIVHLVLARIPDAPDGTRGISLFLVPKFLVAPDGGIGERNDVKCVSIEHKLGIHASPTCVLSFGDEGGAVGYMVSEPNSGMRSMFTMMNNARLSVGLQGLAVAERAYQQALAYAQERRQGRAPGAPAGESSPIIDHPDVRRMLFTQRAHIEAMRALIYTNARALDTAHNHLDADERAKGQELADLLTPLSKGWCTDLGNELTSLALQIHGGMGYVEETGAAQHYRDARIAAIYEGTNGIQAIDLVGRKLPMRGGQVVKELIARMGEIDAELAAHDDLAALRQNLADGLSALSDTSDHLGAALAADPSGALAGATPYLRLFATVVGGWLMARQALAAKAAIAAGSGDTAFLEAKVVTARFYGEQLLPPAVALAPAVKAGAGDLFAVDAGQLAGT